MDTFIFRKSNYAFFTNIVSLLKNSHTGLRLSVSYETMLKTGKNE